MPLARIDSESGGPYSAYEQKQYERYIVDTSGGLLEVVYSQAGQRNVADTGRDPFNTKSSSPQQHGRIVQVIHESVSDFFTKGDGAKTIGFVTSQDFTTATRSSLSEACLRLLQDKWISDALETADQSTSTSMGDLIVCAKSNASRHLWSVYPEPDFPLYVGKHLFEHCTMNLASGTAAEILLLQRFAEDALTNQNPTTASWRSYLKDNRESDDGLLAELPKENCVDQSPCSPSW
jgi:hypothetical protein